MKGWHWGLVIAVLVGYALGIIFPSIGQSVKSKVGMA
jgi:hypothetical protein